MNRPTYLALVALAAAAAVPATSQAQFTTRANPYNASADSAKKKEPTAAQTAAAAAQASAPSILDMAKKNKSIVVVDGVRASEKAVETFDVSRIATIEVLRGASVVKRYGDAAKGGVVVITTLPKNAQNENEGATEVDGFTQVVGGG